MNRGSVVAGGVSAAAEDWALGGESLEPATRVKLGATGEVGIVIYSWFNDEIDGEDNYVAFFGAEFPAGQPSDKPYVLRYSSSSLEVLAQPG